MNIHDIKRNLSKFFQGEPSEESRRYIDRWYHFFDERAGKLKNFDEKEKEELRNRLWTDIRASAGLPGKQLQWKVDGFRPGHRTWPYKMAAGFAVLLLALVPVLMFISDDPGPVSVEFRTSSNPAGQASQLTLADGSVVWLSANSTLHYPERFEGNYREVALQGEAFFDVVSNPGKPFVVNSEHLQTRVLGTSFNIRSYENEEEIEITVASGRVSIERNVDSEDIDKSAIEKEPVAILDPDQQLVFNRGTQTGITQVVDSGLFTSWKDGKLSFENHTFEEIARRLERWYGVQIHFAEPELKQTRFRITFENSSLQHALRMLQVIKDFEFEIEERRVQIRN